MSAVSKTFEMQSTTAVQPLPPRQALWYFLIPGLAVRLAIYQGIPLLQDAGLQPYEAFSVAFLVPMAVLFALALGMAKAEGTPMTWRGLAERLRLRRLTLRHLGWTAAGLLIMIAAGGALGFTRFILLDNIAAVQPPASFPPILHPANQNETLVQVAATWMGPGAAGNWGWALLALIVFFFNIMGEELFFRGYVLPRQELAHGRFAWLIHGLLWNAMHLFFYPWYLIFGLSLTLVIPFVAQKTQNTWTAVILHALANVAATLLMVTIAAGGVQ